MKKCKYLILSLLFMGATSVFTGCIDTDEPAGITELRGAKSELLKAKASLELANAAYIDAETAYKLAQVEYQLIQNRLKELDIQEKEAKLAMQAARDEEEKARLQRELDKIANEREVIAEKHEAAMLKAKQETAEAQEAYDNAMKAIEAAKLILTPEEQTVLRKANNTFNSAKTTVNEAYRKLASAQSSYQTALLLYTGKNIEADLKHKLAVAEYKLAAVEKTVNEIEALLKKVKDKEVIPAAEWDAELTRLNAELVGMELELDEAELSKERIKFENHDLFAEVNARETAYNTANRAEITLEKYERPITEDNIIANLNNYIQSNGLFVDGYDRWSGTFSYQKTWFTNQSYQGAIDEEYLLYPFFVIDGWLDLMSKAGVTNKEEVAHKEVELALQKVVVKEAKDAEKDAIKEWKDALKAWQDADEDDKDDAYDDLRDASVAAFGTALDYENQPRLTQPDEAEFVAFIADGGSYAALGAVGVRMEAEEICSTIQTIVDQQENYLALTKALEEQKELILDIAEKNKQEVENLYAVYEAGQNEYDELFVEVNELIDGHTILIREYKGFIETLEGYIATYLTYDGDRIEGANDYEGFIKALEVLLQEKQAALILEEGKVAKAQEELDLYISGEYTEEYALAEAKLEYDTAMDAYKMASARYDAAYKALENVINVLLK